MRKAPLAVLICITVTLFTASGCMILGKNKENKSFESEKIEQLKPGETTASDVLKLLGTPTSVVKLSNGNAYIFKRVQSKGTGLILFVVNMGYTNTHYDQLVCFFNDQNILTHYGLTMDAENARYGLP
ncbi:MAG: outer membrane protein assembly factor BamE [Deltaproteobacteria bacterium]|nr:outer membrane protein assembly factor BamE [Deltaproteobacteria bacterium]